MKRFWFRRLAIAIFIAYLLAIIWPVAYLMRAAEPFVFGLPLSMAWPIAWIVVGWVTLLLLDHFERRNKKHIDQQAVEQHEARDGNAGRMN